MAAPTTAASRLARPWPLAAAALAAGAAYTLFARSRPEPSPISYGPVRIVATHPDASANGARRITVALPATLAKSLTTTPVPFFFNVKNTDLVVARSFTPVHVDVQNRTMDLLVKRYKVGETSKWMHRRAVDDEIEVNGPLREWTLPAPSEVSALRDAKDPPTLAMIAGGTGVTPFIQILEAALGHSMSPDPNAPQTRPPASDAAAAWPRFSLVYAAPEDDLLAKQQLDALAAKFPDRVSVHYVTNGRQSLTADALRDTLPAPGQAMVLVCGPDGLINHVAGRRGWESQGPLGGLLAQLGYRAEEVYKF
ncbi:hypothetical protein AMAG_03508 [Allomyces macrogynus ATCC 38327]|uniref:FAD-binding FR-type domain-containing protein n=1 Tax=Allomyces macrogynus (strain ATCC 38327) TaxID=578462 RepID=A0A0L0S996_ALLM3|nr:hypothetical protein AMAG_03508 [Allomyces macrogynus ATCC 38327]|eukprot:KNE59183.1 hypothetical protein AMAG_03508 [Allomyces macrogynus ATCC 38327]